MSPTTTSKKHGAVKDRYAALPDTWETRDNFPLKGAGSFGRLGRGTYYMQDEPSKTLLATTARQTPLGKRMTYIFADDIYANLFSFEFPDLKLSSLEIKQINNQIRKHLTEIHFYDEARRACGFDFEQGEAILIKYRKGDGIIYLEEPQLDPKTNAFNYMAWSTAEDTSKEILRVEAKNYLDYTIPQIGSFGAANYYHVYTYTSLQNSESTSFATIKLHPSRAVRWRADNIDYEPYRGSSKLKACFDHLQLIQSMLYNMGNAVHRFAYGQPWIRTKNIHDDKGRNRIKNLLGSDPSDLTYFQTPDEFITDIKMLGVAQSQMDISKLIQDNAQLCAASIGIPKQILMSEQIGMLKPGQVTNPDYFAAIDKEHNKQNSFIRQFVAVDPFFARLFKEYKIDHFDINWGLKNVMTQMEQMDYDMRKANNAVAKMNYSSFKEIRNYDGLPSWEEYYKTVENGEAECMRMYGITPRQLDLIPPNFLTFRQQGAQELVTTPEERKQEQVSERTQELAENNNPTNVSRSNNGETPGSQKTEKAKEALRRESKNLREGAKEGGKDVEEISDEDYRDELIRTLRRALNTARVENSMNKLAKEIGVDYKTLYKLQEGLKNL